MRSVNIIDYGLGNILSLTRALEYLGCDVNLVEYGDRKYRNAPIILPGVGAFPKAMERIRAQGLDDLIFRVADAEVPLLGICLGMQLLFDESSEHHTCNGLGLLNGGVTKIKSSPDANSRLKVPSVGWNEIMFNNESRHINENLMELSRGDFYFVHSYYARANEQSDVLAWYMRSQEKITAAVAKGCILGVQFHPEKSGSIGLKMLKMFIDEKFL